MNLYRLTPLEKWLTWMLVVATVLFLWRWGNPEPAMPKCNPSIVAQHERCYDAHK